jgi:hypothetical protein
MTTTIDIAYCAGLVDGEGYIGVKRTKAYACQGKVTPGYHARIGIKMVNENAIKFFAETMGGWYWTEKSSLANGRPYFVYQATDAKAEGILRILLPYLRVKDEAAKTVIRLRELQADSRKHRTKVVGEKNFPNKYGTVRMVPVKSLSDEYIALCDSLYLRCRELNKVGIS